MDGWKNVTYIDIEIHTFNRTHFVMKMLHLSNGSKARCQTLTALSLCHPHPLSSSSSSSSTRHNAWRLSFFLRYCHFCHWGWRFPWMLKAKKFEIRFVIQSKSFHISWASCRLCTQVIHTYTMNLPNDTNYVPYNILP